MKSRDGIVALIIAGMVAGSIVAFAIIANQIPIESLDKLIILAAILAGSGFTLLMVDLWRRKKKADKIDKGKKLAEVRCRLIECYTKDLKYVMYFVVSGLVLVFISGVAISVYDGKLAIPLLYSIPLLIFYYVVFFKERKIIEIYEKGVKYGVAFHEWNEVSLDGNRLTFKKNSTIKISLDDDVLKIVQKMVA
jgi:uncharacterized membrane protein YfcA